MFSTERTPRVSEARSPKAVAIVTPAVPRRPTAAPSRQGRRFPYPLPFALADIAAESPRILTCKYCDSDLYLLDALWHALHPVKKRAPFRVAFDE